MAEGNFFWIIHSKIGKFAAVYEKTDFWSTRSL